MAELLSLPARTWRGLKSLVHNAEQLIATFSLVLLAVIPIAEALLRKIGIHIPDASAIIKHLILPITFLGATLAAKEKQHFSISVGLDQRSDWLGMVAILVPRILTALFSTVFLLSSLPAIVSAPEFSVAAWFIPQSIFFAFIPIGFLILIYRMRPERGSRNHGAAWIGFGVGVLIGIFYAFPAIRDFFHALGVPVDGLASFDESWGTVMVAVKPFFIGFVALSLLVGTPIFVVLGGVAAILYTGDFSLSLNGSIGASSVISASYEMMTQDSVIAIALFSFTGFILSESQSGQRFVNLFKNLFASVPGGFVIVAVLVSAFFTTFTGASGVTILALGGLLYAFLMEGGRNTERFSTGLLTSSGSIGLLFPPSLALIMFGSTIQVDIRHMFVAGLLPGLLMLLAMIVAGFLMSRRTSAQVLVPFNLRATLKAAKSSFWEALLPVVIIVIYFSGLATLTETAAFSVLYTLIIEVFVKREIDWAAFRRLTIKSLVVVGSVLIILSVARGLKNYLSDNGVPEALRAWISMSIHDQWVFLLLLNGLLLIVGAFMDIFSAIVVVVPLILPLAVQFGVHPIHLGMIFLANMEVGFMMPPAGINLFLASYRFGTPLIKVYRSVLPFILIQIAVVLIVTYVPWLATALVPK